MVDFIFYLSIFFSSALLFIFLSSNYKISMNLSCYFPNRNIYIIDLRVYMLIKSVYFKEWFDTKIYNLLKSSSNILILSFPSWISFYIWLKFISWWACWSEYFSINYFSSKFSIRNIFLSIIFNPNFDKIFSNISEELYFFSI